MEVYKELLNRGTRHNHHTHSDAFCHVPPPALFPAWSRCCSSHLRVLLYGCTGVKFAQPDRDELAPVFTPPPNVTSQLHSFRSLTPAPYITRSLPVLLLLTVV